jgi:cytochrome c biogenesis protein CcdA
MDPVQLVIAFTAGALAFLSPCSLPMLPAYVSYYLEMGEKRGSILTGLALALSLVAGFLVVFVFVGLVLSFTVSGLVDWVWVAEPVIGVGLILLGILTWFTDLFDRVPRIGLSVGGGRLSFLIYGAAYGFASMGCSLPIFILVVVEGATAGSFEEMLALFGAYGAGAAALIIPLTLTLSLANGLIHEKLTRILPHMKKLNAVVLILAGLYMLASGIMR